MIIIGITGTIGAGKSTLAACLVENGFTHYSAKAFISEEIKRRGLVLSRDTAVAVGNDLRKQFGPGYVIESLHKEALKEGRNAVLESVRTVGEVGYLRSHPGFFLIAVDAEPKIRYGRITKRQSDFDRVSFSEFLEQEAREMHSADSGRQSIREVMKTADFSVVNNGSPEELTGLVSGVLKKIL